MSFPVLITYRGVDSSEPLSRSIRSEAAKLSKFFDGIVRCRALIERPPGHHHAGAPFHIRLTLTVPGAELIIEGETGESAFRRARRRLHDYARRNLTHPR